MSIFIIQNRAVLEQFPCPNNRSFCGGELKVTFHLDNLKKKTHYHACACACPPCSKIISSNWSMCIDFQGILQNSFVLLLCERMGRLQWETILTFNMLSFQLLGWPNRKKRGQPIFTSLFLNCVKQLLGKLKVKLLYDFDLVPSFTFNNT